MKCSRLRGKKGLQHPHKEDLPRSRRLSRRGRGNFANDRPPVLGMVGRESQQARFQVIPDTAHETLDEWIVRWTQDTTTVYSDAWQGYDDLTRQQAQVNHHHHEWARDDDGDGICEVHTNRIEGLWTGLRSLLRPFRGVSKHYLNGYVAIYRCRVNQAVITPSFISRIVHVHTSFT